MERTLSILARFLCVGDNMVRYAAHERMFEAFIDGQFAPLIIDDFRFGLAVAAIFIRNIQKAVRRIGAAVQNNILNPLAQLIGDIIINRQLTRIDNRHIETCRNGVIEKDRMHGFAHRIISAKGETDIRQSARNPRMRQIGFNTFASFKERDGVIIMLLNPCRHSENIGIEYDVFRREIHFIDEQIIGPLTDAEFIIRCLGLAFFVKGHDDGSGAQISDDTRMGQKLSFALFHRDRIDNGFALYAFQPRFENLPFGAINHDRHPGNIRLARHELQEARHGRDAVNQSVIHIDVNNLGAAFNLLPRNRKRFFVIIIDDQFFKPRRACDIGAFTDIDKLCGS